MTRLLKDKYFIIALLTFLGFTVVWLYIFLTGANTHTLITSIFGATYGLMALVGAIFGILISRKYGSFKSALGRAILAFSFGLLAQEFGQVVYTYYLYGAGIEIPYPSYGDIGYFGSVLLYIYGALQLSKAAGVRLVLGSYKKKSVAVIVPALLLGFAYWLFLANYDYSNIQPLTVLLDFGYPLGQAVYISIALVTILLSRGMLGGIMKSKVEMVLVALTAQFIADYTFLFQTKIGTWAAGGINDYMYLVAYFLMTVALIRMKLVFDKVKEAK